MKPRIPSAIRISFPLAAAIAAMLAGPSAQAASITWGGATNAWNTNTNWVDSVLPVNNDSLFFAAAGVGGLSLNNDLTTGSFTVSSIIFTGTAGAYVIGNGTATANVGNTFVLGVPATTAVFTSSLTNASPNLQTINTPFTMTTARSFIGGADIALAGNISGTGGGITKNGTNTLILSGSNSYTGQTTVNQGLLRLDSAGALSSSSNLNFNGGVVGLNFGDFTRAIGTGATQVQFGNAGGWAAYGANRAVNLGGNVTPTTYLWGGTTATGLNGKTLILSYFTSDFTVDFQNPLNMEGVARTVQVDNGSAAIDGKLSGAITGIASGNLTKTGLGTLLLTGTNNYAGTTTVSAGKLLVNGTNTVTGLTTVNSGASLGGSGSITGAVTVATGGRINLQDGVVGNLTLGSTLTLSGSSTAPNNLHFDLGGAVATTDQIVTSGAVTAAGASGVLVNFNQLTGGPVTPGTGKILIQAGAASTYANYALATTRSGGNVYSNLTASGNDLVVDIATAAAGSAAAFWVGGANPWSTVANWNTDASSSSALGSIPGVGTNVTFATTTPIATNLTTNTVDADFEINSLTFDDAAGGVIIAGTKMLTLDATNANGNTSGNGITSSNTSGTNTISTKIGLGGNQTWTTNGGTLTVSGVISDFGGDYGLTKAGTGTLTLSGVNTFTGPLTVSGGTLNIGGAGQLNAGTHGSNILNNGIFSYASSANQTLVGVISGTGALTKSGGSTLSINSGNTYSGGTTITAGTVVVNSSSALGTGAVTVTGGTLTNGVAGLILPNSLTLNGGTLGISYNGTTPQWSGPVTLTANSTISAQSSGGGGIVSGNIGESGGSYGFTKTGGDRLAIVGTSNTYNGPTIVSTGVLTFRYSLYGNDTLKWIPANISVNSAATLALNIGGAGEFTASQAGTLFSQLATSVNNNGLRAGSTMAFDITNATSIQTVSATLTDSVGTGGGAVGLSILGTNNTLELTGPNTFSGPVITDRNNTLKVSSLNSVATNPGLGTVHSASSSLGAPITVPNGTISLGNQSTYAGGTLLYTGTGEITDRVIKLGGANGQTFTLDQSGSGLLKFVSNMTHGDTRGLKTFQLQGSTAGTGEFAGVIINPGTGTNILGLTKSGTGTWTISAANLYTAVTQVNGGALVLNNASALPGGIGATGGTSALTFNGGVIGLGVGDFTRNLAASGIVDGAYFNNAGGWAAYGADRAVNLGGALASITWATQNGGLNGKTLILGNATSTHTLDFQNPLVLDANNRTVQVDNGSAAIDGKLSGALSGGAGANFLLKTGLGTLALTGTNSIVSQTRVDAGTLLVNGSNTGSGTVSVSSGTLGGSGSITGAVTIGNGVTSGDSILAPGNSIDSLDTGNLTFNSDGSYAVELNGTSVATDVTNVNGTVSINAATTLTVSLTGSLAGGQKYFIVNNDGGDAVTGTFFNLLQDAVVGNFGGTDLKISYTGDSGTSAITGGNDIVLYTSGSPYDTWAALKGLDGTPGKNPAKTADSDNDGRNNLAEFAFDGNPLSGANDGKIVGKVATVGGNQVMTLTLPVRAVASFSPDSGDQLSALIDGIYYRIEGDVNLSTFADTITEVTSGEEVGIQAGLPALSAVGAPGWTYRTFRHSGTVPATPKAFLRAKVSETP